MARQLRHSIPDSGLPCDLCGLTYSPETAYIPCFENGDTFEMWRDRNKKALDALPESKRPVTLQSTK